MLDALSWLYSLDPLSFMVVLFFIGLSSPLLVILALVTVYQFVTRPIRNEDEEPFGDWPHIEETTNG